MSGYYFKTVHGVTGVNIHSMSHSIRVYQPLALRVMSMYIHQAWQ
jgi:hypothetical protein